jgi:hypothetical protein
MTQIAMKRMIPFENGFQNGVGMIPIGVSFKVYYLGIIVMVARRRHRRCWTCGMVGITILLQLGGKGL